MSKGLWIILSVLAAGLVLLIANHDDGTTFGLANDDFASLLYLGTLGVVLAAAVFFGGARTSGTLRQIAAWLAVFLVLVGGYQYRFELQDIASRLTAGLVPGSPHSGIDANGQVSVMVTRGLDNHFEVRADLNGVTVPMLVDTGATSTVLTSEDARSIGIDPDALQFDFPVMTANGRTTAARTTVSDFALGDIRRVRLDAMVARPGQLDQSLLGMNFLNSLSSFEFSGDRLLLRD